MVLNKGSFLLSNVVSPFELWAFGSCLPFLDVMPGRREGAGRRQGSVREHGWGRVALGAETKPTQGPGFAEEGRTCKELLCAACTWDPLLH